MKDRKHSPSLYPAFLDLQGQLAVVIGGGAVAVRKVRSLIAAGASVLVVAKDAAPELRRIKGVRLAVRPFRKSDLKGARLVFAATDAPELNSQIAKTARKRGAWVNVAAPPESGNMLVPSSFRRGKLCVAFSTGGASAAAAKALREELEKHVDPAWGILLELVDERREILKRTLDNPKIRRELLQMLGQPKWLEKIRSKGREFTARQMDQAIVKGIRGRS